MIVSESRRGIIGVLPIFLDSRYADALTVITTGRNSVLRIADNAAGDSRYPFRRARKPDGGITARIYPESLCSERCDPTVF